MALIDITRPMVLRAFKEFESPQVFRRLHFLRGWSNEQIQKIFPGNPGTCSTHGV